MTQTQIKVKRHAAQCSSYMLCNYMTRSIQLKCHNVTIYCFLLPPELPLTSLPSSSSPFAYFSLYLS